MERRAVIAKYEHGSQPQRMIDQGDRDVEKRKYEPKAHTKAKGTSWNGRFVVFACASISLGMGMGMLGRLSYCDLDKRKNGVREEGGLRNNAINVESKAAISTVIRAPTHPEEPKELYRIGEEGGAWTAQTHLMKYGFNVDAGLVDVLEESCREIENQRQPDGSMWTQHPGSGPIHGLWRPPKVVDCRVLELGPGVGVYVDSLKKDQAKHKRKVIGIEPNPMGGTFDRRNGPKQLAINILEAPDSFQLGQDICKTELGGESFDLIYSIEVCEHMPLERHEDAAKFLAGLSRKGTKLIFGAAHIGQTGTGHIGNRSKQEWEAILAKVGFVKDMADSLSVATKLNEYNHKVNTQVYYFIEK